MRPATNWLALVVAFAAIGFGRVTLAQELPPIKPIERRLPPMGIELPPEAAAKLTARLEAVEKQLSALPADTPNRADAAVFVKAVRFAVDLREFYDVKDVAKAERALDEAALRIEQLKAGRTPWLEVRGRTIVRGFASAIDGSVQPYGVTVPAGLDLSKPAPLHVWLHGRNDKGTDVHFIDELARDKCTWKSEKAIVVQPFGRHCIAFKGPGEVDVFEAIDAVDATWKNDRDRIALLGFSMGGAGAWHIGAHYADRFCVVHAGAGFVDVRRYLNVDPATVPGVERTLWGVYDVPDYVRNLLNVPVIAYSGELDKQKASADIMEEAFAAEGRKLDRIIGPKMGHKYDPESLRRIHEIVDAAVAKGRDRDPSQISIQTRWLRYWRLSGIQLTGLVEHWKDSQLDATVAGNVWSIVTKNVRGFSIFAMPPFAIMIDGQPLPRVDDAAHAHHFARSDDGRWAYTHSGILPELPPGELRKQPGLQGPIDDAFNSPFLIVLPSGKSNSARIERWIAFESAHQVRRWRELMRGDAIVKRDADVTPDDVERYNLVLWGDADSNALIAKIADKLPLKRTDAGKSTVTAMIWPNPLNPQHYVVLNSGPTFREAHDRTNSLQNPKLGDWAIIDVTVDPDAEKPGRIVEAGFFDEDWKMPAGGSDRADSRKRGE